MKKTLGSRFPLLAVAALIVWPDRALACAVCMTGLEDKTRIAFEWMTGFMTIMPFLLAGGVLWWLRGRLKETESMHERAREKAEANQAGGNVSARPGAGVQSTRG